MAQKLRRQVKTRVQGRELKGVLGLCCVLQGVRIKLRIHNCCYYSEYCCPGCVAESSG